MKDNETAWDTRLRIKTAGRDDWNADEYRFPYEPTPYTVLERLADSGLIKSSDVLLDYGCGKGRVGFFLSHRTGAKCIGIEYDERMLAHALQNQQQAPSGTRTAWIQAHAEDYEVPAEVSRCYFFNPFSVEILRHVLARILESYYAHPRELLLFFYYPSKAYLSCLMEEDMLDFYDEIPCGDLFSANDPREQILIFSLPAP